MPVDRMLAARPRAIILSGGPSSVHADGAPRLDPALLEAGVPVLGLCYGFQAMAAALGGTVAPTGVREYGATRLKTVDASSQLDRKSTRLNSSHVANSYSVFCLQKK